ncbi:MAG: DUF4169 family protein [Roseicyclus sp.]|nr:DUF4169 family protein [Roseicyclus sp.]MBO6626103.1 DUF4169 family protein [Roseicyclus sp.]MBO6924101.1 DUF4169 family protein [Roseicyclus sp.]
MSEIVHLNKARKIRSRAEKKAMADANAVKHGRSKAERMLDATRDAQARKLLDDHERETE